MTVMSHKSKVRAVIPISVRRPEKSGGQVIDIDTLHTLLEPLVYQLKVTGKLKCHAGVIQ
jgi:hypothetical protein